MGDLPPTREYPEERPHPAAPDADGWRLEVKVAATLNVLLALWIISSPFLLAYAADEPFWAQLVAGGSILVLASARLLGAHDATWASGLNMLAGASTVAVGLLLFDGSAGTWNCVIAGSAVFGIAGLSVAASSTRPPPELVESRHGR